MRSFKQYLVEFKITPEEALKILGIDAETASDPNKLKKAYRKASIESHPDKGGSVEDMQNVNVSYDILKKTPITAMGKEGIKSWKEQRQKEQEDISVKANVIKQDLISKFNPVVFQAYFKEIFKKPFDVKIQKYFPDSNTRGKGKGGFNVDFISKDGNTIFQFNVYGWVGDILEKASLGGGDISYEINVEAYGLHNNKKQKMSARDWKYTNNHELFSKPEKTFPKAKLKKIAQGKTRKGKFTKRDMETIIKKKLDGISSSGNWYIPIGDGIWMPVTRMVFMREGIWNIRNLIKEVGPDKLRIGKVGSNFEHLSMPENEDIAKLLQEIQKQAMKIKDSEGIKKAKLVEKYMTEWKKVYFKEQGIEDYL